MLYSRTIETPIGEMLACAAEDGICLLKFTDSPDLKTGLEKLQEDF
jgi:methylated-DNA-[protein]-cysteine S-methyltransferase